MNITLLRITAVYITIFLVLSNLKGSATLTKSQLKNQDFIENEIFEEIPIDNVEDSSEEIEADFTLGGGKSPGQSEDNHPSIDKIEDNNIPVFPIPVFNYKEENGKVYLSLNNEKQVVMKFGENDVSIEQSYLYSKTEEISYILSFVKYYLSEIGYEMKRDDSELIGEYKLHTFLYNIGYKQKQTGTLNWDYGYDKRWYVNVASKILGEMEVFNIEQSS